MAKVELIDVAHAYVPGKYAVKNINLTWEDGVASALLGPSGCGKTTLLKIISGLLTPSEGTVLLDGKDVTTLSPRERNIAQVFQFPVIYETLSVYDNLAFPLRNRGVSEKEIRLRVGEIADILELRDVLRQRAKRLGADFKQRVSMGRGIVRSDTAAVLFDEPLTVIDPLQKWHLRRKVKELHQRTNYTMVYVTHDQHEALTFADQVTIMDVGRAVQTGSPRDLHEQPQTPFVGYFIGSPGMNLFSAERRPPIVHIGKHQLNIPRERFANASSAELQLGIRPEYVKVSESNLAEAIPCTVKSLQRTGHAQIVELRNDDMHFKARIGEFENYEIGRTVWATLPPEHICIYEKDQLVQAN